MIATGTPCGVGAATGEFLRAGDVVTAAIDGLGQISNRVTDADVAGGRAAGLNGNSAERSAP